MLTLQDAQASHDKRAEYQQQIIIDDAVPPRNAEATWRPDWDPPPRQPEVLNAWKTVTEKHIRSYALTAVRQMIDGSTQDVDDTVQKVRLANAQLASSLSKHEQITRARTHLNSVDDETQTTQDPFETLTTRLN